MTIPIDLSTIVKTIRYWLKIVQTVVSNKQACANVANDLATIHEILTNLGVAEELKTEQYK
jgi:hypothetical protein